MGSAPYDGADAESLSVFKILVAGGFGAGKTTFVGAISEVRPLRTEEVLTSASAGFDSLDGVENKTRTTVAMDFGRITIGRRRVLYLFGTPGQERFWFMWDDLSYGALGAVVIADTRRLSDSFASVDYFERRGLPFPRRDQLLRGRAPVRSRRGTRCPRPWPAGAGCAVRRTRAKLREAGADHPGRVHPGQQVRWPSRVFAGDGSARYRW